MIAVVCDKMADGMVLTTGFVLILLLGCLEAQDLNCDFQQNVQINQTYTIQSPGYPSNYPPGKQCRWIGYCPQGYNCRLDCPYINIPQSPSCSVDRLLISRSGDPYLTGADRYCSYGSLSVVSTGNTISVGLISSSSSSGGSFYCTLKAQVIEQPPQTCSCGYKKTNRIVGGVETGVNEYPMMVGLVDVVEGAIKCGGVIVTNRAVLTAAHCVKGKENSIRAVVVGEHDVTVGDSPATAVYPLSPSFLIHPRYSADTVDYDIAIVNTMAPIPFSDRVGPVCLPFKFANNDFAGKTVTALGWGTLFIGGPTSKTLQKVDLQVISQSQCQATNPSFLSARQMCTYTPGKDACQDDSGGPLLYTDPSNGLLYSAGIISSGRLCAARGYPGINTRVTQHLSWIQENTYPYQLCVK